MPDISKISLDIACFLLNQYQLVTLKKGVLELVCVPETRSKALCHNNLRENLNNKQFYPNT